MTDTHEHDHVKKVHTEHLHTLVKKFANGKFKNHPFFQNEKNYDLTHLWAVIMIGRSYKRMDAIWLANLSARIKDPELRCMLIEDLSDDLGHGDYSKRQGLVLEQIREALTPWAKKDKIELLKKEDKDFAHRLNKVKKDRNVDIALGGVMVGYIFGEIIIDYFKKTIMLNKASLDEKQLKWFHGHSHLEYDHKDETFSIAEYIAEHSHHLEKLNEGAEAAETIYCDTFDKLNQI